MARKPNSAADRVGELQDELKRRDERIAELHQEIDELRDLLNRMEESVDDSANVIERWKEAFDMAETESGSWTWKPFWDERKALVDKFNDLVRQWNKYLPVINGRTQPVGRPLAASEVQQATVRKLHKAGKSLRWIAEETSLGFNTVRTIVGKAEGTDRTTRKHLARIDPDRQQAIRWKRQQRTGDDLPRQAQHAVEEARALLKEGKGLGR
jgi:uncharacterized coiled-coil DUF342 family protein